jgi:L-iditol 2-dehydrogenase
MRSLVLEQPGSLAIQDTPKPDIGPNDVLVQVKACGICGSDVHGYDGSTGRRIPPLIMGHEASGVVANLGDQVTQFKLGDRVTFDSTVSCGSCGFCAAGDVNLCEARQVLGVSCGEYRRQGAFAEFVAVPEHIVYPLPDALSFEQAALIEAVSIAVHAAKLTPIRAGDTAVVFGAGMIGLLAMQVFRIYGCTRIIAVDVDQSRLQLALAMGADMTFVANSGTLDHDLENATHGEGPQIVVEAVGLPASVNAAIQAVRRGGCVTLIGNLAPKVEIPLQAVVTRQIRLQGSCASAGEYPECIDLMARGAVNVDPFISAVAPLSEGPAWFDRLHRRETGLVKVILKPDMADNTQ